MFWSSVALYLVAFALPVGTGRFGESGFLAFTYGVFLCLRAPWLWAGWLANGVYWLAVIVVASRRNRRTWSKSCHWQGKLSPDYRDHGYLSGPSRSNRVHSGVKCCSLS